MVFLQFSGKHAHVPVPGPVTRQSIWKWSTLITEMQIKRKEDLPQNVEQRSMLSSLASAGKQRAMASATKIKPRKKCMSGYRVTKCDGVLESSSKVSQESGAQGLVQMASKYLQ